MSQPDRGPEFDGVRVLLAEDRLVDHLAIPGEQELGAGQAAGIDVPVLQEPVDAGQALLREAVLLGLAHVPLRLSGHLPLPSPRSQA